MKTGIRLISASAGGFVVTVGLFLFMLYLIAGGENSFNKEEEFGSIRFGPVEIDDELEIRKRAKPKPPPPPKQPPPPPKLTVQNVQKVVSPIPNLQLPKLDIPVSGSGPFLGAFGAAGDQGDGDIIPLVRITPQYPRRAALAKIEGYVTVEFTITETGTVSEPRVIDAKPPRVFDREAIRAILKWKFKPRVVDGVATTRRATQTLDFNLASN